LNDLAVDIFGRVLDFVPERAQRAVDIGTVVLPEADLKLYLQASPEARARRRWREIQARGEEADHQEILASMKARDRLDSTREIAPLRPADDAIVLDTTELSIEETFERALALARGEDQPDQ
jgi:cytidylate kinase